MQRLAGTGLSFEVLGDAAFDSALAQTYRDTASEASKAAADHGDLAALADSAAMVDDLLDQSDDAPVVRLINALLLEAIKENASDIHIEPQERRLVVRFRIDGILREVLEPRRALAPLLVSRIKVMARLDIAEKRLPQDGRISLACRRPRGRRARLDHPLAVRRAGGAADPRPRRDAARPRPARHEPARPRRLRAAAGAAERHPARHRADRLGQDDHALCRARLDSTTAAATS